MHSLIMVEYGILSYITALILIALVWLLVKRCLSRQSCLPPGPWALPVIGSVQAIGRDVRETFPVFRKKYGDVFSVYVGNTLMIAIGGAATVREALVKYGHVFSDRPRTFIFDVLLQKSGLLATNGRLWKEQRTFTLQKFREFGMGKVILGERIRDEIGTLIDNLSQSGGEAMDVSDLLQRCVGNVIFNIVASKRYAHDDPEFVRFCKAITDNVKQRGMIKHIYPSLAKLVSKLTGDTVMVNNRMLIDEIVEKHMKEHEKHFVAEDIRDLIDAYLLETEKRKDESIFSLSLGKKLILDLLVGGTETTSSTLIWSVLYLALNQHIQFKAQRELDDVIGRDRLISCSDKPRLSYMNATIIELQRMANIAFFLPPHCPTEDTIFRGFMIPKGTPLLFMIGEISADPELWHDPDVFNPERFLSDGNVHNSDKFTPFGIGPRACPGESLAKMELFLVLTTILQRFSICLPEGAPVPSTKVKWALLMRPEPFKVCFVPRP